MQQEESLEVLSEYEYIERKVYGTTYSYTIHYFNRLL